MKEQEDIILIQNILNGNHQAEEVFFNKYKKIVKDFLKNKFSKYNIDDIDDCVSSILIKVFENLSKYDSEKSSVKTWVLVIAKHYMIDIWRSKAVSNNNMNTSITYEGPFINQTFSASLSGFVSNSSTCSTTCFENNDALTYISTQLSPQDFTLLNMKYVQGYNYCEIGSEFQLTSSTVSNKINYIKTKLKKDMSEDIYE